MDTKEISRLCATMTLKEREGPVRTLKEELRVEGLLMISCSLVGKVLTKQQVNREAFMAVMTKVWHVKGRVDIETVSHNIFAFHFTDPDDKRMVIAEGPWTFDNALIVFEEPKGMGVFRNFVSVAAFLAMQRGNARMAMVGLEREFAGNGDGRYEGSQSALNRGKECAVTLGRISNQHVQTGKEVAPKGKEVGTMGGEEGSGSREKKKNHEGEFVFKSQHSINVVLVDVDAKMGDDVVELVLSNNDKLVPGKTTISDVKVQTNTKVMASLDAMTDNNGVPHKGAILASKVSEAPMLTGSIEKVNVGSSKDQGRNNGRAGFWKRRARGLELSSG
ncbi:hypothetical protein EZV62_018104 [Acer yangbiense]|uniref:DUF4283 domain-containing protein n=1 Tax=Acer yangbiense TaxID=1000413 RepID=A0A5C7HIF6_9ROSI|nr:hypothetical protein EZV62_018104 [Acer yangbiense]